METQMLITCEPCRLAAVREIVDAQAMDLRLWSMIDRTDGERQLQAALRSLHEAIERLG